MERLTISEVVNPHTFEFKEALFYCKHMFGLNEEEVSQITKQMMFPYKIFPDKLHMLIAKKGSELVGFALTYFLFDCKLTYMEYICVMPEYRRQGIGTAIYSHALELVRQDNCELGGMLFEVNHDEEGLEERLRFFAKMGAIPLDVSGVQLFKGYDLQLFYHSMGEERLFPVSQVPQVMEDLTSVWIY
jgi:GNAT superfamily N-acetyltransferase